MFKRISTGPRRSQSCSLSEAPARRWATPTATPAASARGSGVAPAGSSDEFPDGVLIQFVHVNLGQAGPIISAAAHEHLLSHEACHAGE
jgi:hypothetical protein